MDSPRTPTDDRPIPPGADDKSGDRRAAGTVFAVIVGALLLSALLNAETMLSRAESGRLGWSRDVALSFWQPAQEVSSTLGLSAPRDGLEALRDLDRSGPAHRSPGPEPIGDDVAAPRAAPPTGAAPVGPTPPVELHHPPSTGPIRAEPDPPAAPDASPDPAEPSTAASVSSTRPGLPGLPPLQTIRRDAEPTFALRRPTAEEPLRLLIVGDSTLDAVGSSMLRELDATGVTSAVLDFRVSSGLSRPDFFDWPTHLGQLTQQIEPEIVVVMLGANDAQAFAIDNQAVEFGTEQWFTAYRARVTAILDQLTTANRWVVWIGQPVMRNDAFDARMRQINQLFVEEVARYPTATFVDSRAVTVDEAGGYVAFLADAGGIPQQVRQDDGIHLTAAGGDRLSPVVITAINEIAPLY